MGYLKSFKKDKSLKQSKELSKAIDNILASVTTLITFLQSQIEEFSKVVEEFQQIRQTDIIPAIFNSSIFFRITLVDILVTTKQFAKADSNEDKNIIIRNLSIHLYEFLDDTKDFFGKEMLESLKTLPDKEILIADLYKLKGINKAVKDAILKPLGEIRHNTGAHKEHNSLILRNRIKKY